MAKNKTEQQKTENQEVKREGGFSGDNGAAECGACGDANVSEEGDTESGSELSSAEEAAIWKDKYMRLSAEYDNYRKRTLKEKLELINTGGEDVVKSMLEVVDDMDRALAAMENTAEMEAVKQGMVLIANKLNDTLRSKGLSEIEAVGQELDTDLHEAVARIAVEEQEMKGKIVDVIQKGYKLKDKIIRYAKVVVGQ